MFRVHFEVNHVSVLLNNSTCPLTGFYIFFFTFLLFMT